MKKQFHDINYILIMKYISSFDIKNSKNCKIHEIKYFIFKDKFNFSDPYIDVKQSEKLDMYILSSDFNMIHNSS